MTNDKSIDFALIGHPFDIDHLYRYLSYHKPDLNKPRREFLLKLFEWTPPYIEQEVEMTSFDGNTVRGSIIMCPLLPEMVQDDTRSHFRSMCVDKVIAALKLAESEGAKISGLGGFTSIADGDQGRLVARKVPGLSVTSGNTLTAMAAVNGVMEAGRMLGVDLSASTATVVGASGDIGTACCRFLVSRVKRVVLVARFAFNLNKMAEELRQYGKAEIVVEKDNKSAVKAADIVISAASSVAPIFYQRDFKPGAIVCDVGFPKNIFADYDMKRSDIFLFSGGLLSTPSPVFIPYDMGLPDPGVLYGCWSEAVILALEGRYDSFSTGRGHIVPEKMELIWELAIKHGFSRAPFFFGKKIWTEKDMDRVRAMII